MKMIKQITNIPDTRNLAVDIKIIQVLMRNLGYYNGPINGKHTGQKYYDAIVEAHKSLNVTPVKEGEKIIIEHLGAFQIALWKTATGEYANMKPIVAADHVMSCPNEMWALDIPDVADMPLPTAVAETLTERLTRISEKQALPLCLKSEDINVSDDGKLQIKLTVPGNGWLSSTGDFYKTLPMGITSIISIYMSKAGYTVTAGEEDGTVIAHGDVSVEDIQDEEGKKTRWSRVHITKHNVGKVGPWHTALQYTNNEGHTEWISAGPEGTRFELVAAGTAGMVLAPEGSQYLVAGIGSKHNKIRPSDHPDENSYWGNVAPPEGITTQELFERMKKVARSYNNKADYDLFPNQANGYNSNSLVFSVIKYSGGVTNVLAWHFVGGEKIIPRSYFKVTF